MTLYIGGLALDASSTEFADLFAPFGEVGNVRLPRDPSTRVRGRGFGFVTLDDAAALAAIESLNGFAWRGRVLQVRAANVSANRPRLRPIRSGAGGAKAGENGGRPRPLPCLRCGQTTLCGTTCSVQ